ncbi:PLAT domain-containing protein 3-like, partial [Ananas comosus]|uniref:PLAT domain-containing protein 3-like n=1 Tax=Ananas comosus TaxID=4615 RepID=A0A6P5F584_ANACO
FVVRRVLSQSAGSRSSCGAGSECLYTLRVKTGTLDSAGTDSVIGITLAGKDRVRSEIKNLVSWGGMMGSGHDYFENGNIDSFSGCGKCVTTSPPCWMNLTSDGSGNKAGWYVGSVELTAAGPEFGCTKQRFDVFQWLATDEPPYKLYVVRDNCSGRARGNGGVDGDEDK